MNNADSLDRTDRRRSLKVLRGWRTGIQVLLLAVAGLGLASSSSASSQHEIAGGVARERYFQGFNDHVALAILQAVCPGEIQAVSAYFWGVLYGCARCPEFTSLAGHHYNFSGYPNFSLQLGRVLYGSFTRPGASQAVAEVVGCEKHLDTPEDDIRYEFLEKGSPTQSDGGILLLEKDRRGWRRLRYVKGYGDIDRTYRLNNGRHLVLNVGTFVDKRINWVGVYDFSADPERAWHQLIAVGPVPCTSTQGLPSAAKIEKVEGDRISRDGTPDLRVLVQWPNDPKAKPDESNCKVHEIDFSFDGAGFQVTPSTTEELRLMNGLASEQLGK